MVILNRLHRETVLSQPNGGFFKETELRGFVLIVHFGVLLVSKKISRSILKCSGRVMDWAETPFLTSGNEKGRLFDGFDETNKQTPERSYKILRKDRSILRPQKGRFSGFCLWICEKGSSNLPGYQNNAKISFFLSAEFEIKKGGNPLVF